MVNKQGPKKRTAFGKLKPAGRAKAISGDTPNMITTALNIVLSVSLSSISSHSILIVIRLAMASSVKRAGITSADATGTKKNN